MTQAKKRASPGVPPGLFLAGQTGRTSKRRYRLEAYYGGKWHYVDVIEITVPVELPRSQSLAAVALASVGG